MRRSWDQLVVAKEFSVRRSELTCPGHSLKMMAKAAASSADEVVFDLEDACAVSQKAAARQTVIQALSTLDFQGKIRAFRVNSVLTPHCWRDMVEVVTGAGKHVDVLVVPKVNGPEDVHFVDRLLSQLEQELGLVLGGIKLEVLIESARGVLHAEQIATSSPRLASLIFGVADYAGDVGARDFITDAQRSFHYPRAKLLAAARAAGIDAIDGVTVQYRDLDQVRQDSEHGARMGFDGKWAIHPSHLDVIHQAYSPSGPELQRALAIMDAYAKADRERGTGAITYGDEMIDAATLRVEWKKIAVARKAGLLDEQDRLRT